MDDGGESIVVSGGGRRRMNGGHEFQNNDGRGEGTLEKTFCKNRGCAGTSAAADACVCPMDAGGRAAVGGGGGGGERGVSRRRKEQQQQQPARQRDGRG